MSDLVEGEVFVPKTAFCAVSEVETSVFLPVETPRREGFVENPCENCKYQKRGLDRLHGRRKLIFSYNMLPNQQHKIIGCFSFEI